MSEDDPSLDEDAGWVGPAGLAVLCVCSLVVAVLELLYVPLYIGPVVVPVSVLAAVGVNLMMPRWAYGQVASTGAALAPVLCWLVVVIGLSLYNRPEGDLFVLGAYGEKWNYYALVLFGAVAGFVGVARTVPTAYRGASTASGKVDRLNR